MGEAKKALGWSFALNWGQQGISGILSFVLASLLGPENYGIIALAYVFLFFFQIVGGQSFTATLTQRADLRKIQINSVFWFTLFWGTGISFLAFLMGELWADIYESEVLGDVIVWLSPLILLGGLGIVPRGLLLRNMDFRSLAIVMFASVPIGGLVGIYMAFTGYGIWSLVAQQWIMVCISLVVLWMRVDFRPQFVFSLSNLLDLSRFTRGVALSEFGGFAQSRIDAILMGVIFGPVAVGLYRISEKIVQLVTTMLSRSVALFILPFASRHQNDQEKLKEVVKITLQICTSMTFPVMGAIAGASTIILEIIGGEWRVAWVALMILCGVGAIQSFTINTPQLLQGAGRASLSAVHSWGTAIVGGGVLLIVGYFSKGFDVETQLGMVASARLGTYMFLTFPMSIFLMKKIANIRTAEFAMISFFPLLSGICAMGIGVLLSALTFVGDLHVLVKLIFVGGGAYLTGAALLLLLDKKLRSIIFQTLKPIIAKFSFTNDKE